MAQEKFDLASPVVTGLEQIPQYEGLLITPDSFREAYIGCAGMYLNIMEGFSNLSLVEVSQIDQALVKYRQAGGSANSASGNSLPKLWRLTADNREGFIDHLRSIVLPTTQSDYDKFSQQVLVTTAMMSEAFRVNAQAGAAGYQFHDGDPVADRVRWTYLRIVPSSDLGNDTYLHYFVSHLLDQIAVDWISINCNPAKLEQYGVDLKKDGALAIISDLLSYAYGLDVETEQQQLIRTYWETPRDHGGLGWLKQSRLDTFREFFQASAS